jgi:hypothetical protein
MHPDVLQALTAERVRDKIAAAQRQELADQARRPARRIAARRAWRRHAARPVRA